MKTIFSVFVLMALVLTSTLAYPRAGGAGGGGRSGGGSYGRSSGGGSYGRSSSGTSRSSGGYGRSSGSSGSSSTSGRASNQGGKYGQGNRSYSQPKYGMSQNVSASKTMRYTTQQSTQVYFMRSYSYGYGYHPYGYGYGGGLSMWDMFVIYELTRPHYYQPSQPLWGGQQTNQPICKLDRDCYVNEFCDLRQQPGMCVRR